MCVCALSDYTRNHMYIYIPQDNFWSRLLYFLLIHKKLVLAYAKRGRGQ